MATAKKLPSGSWRVQVYAGKDSEGKIKSKSFTAPTKREAEYLALQYQQERKEPAADMTVGQAIDKYIEIKSNIIAPTTIQGYKSIRANRLKGIIDMPLRKLTNNMIQEEVNDMAKRLSSKTVRNTYGLLSATLKRYAPDLHLNVSLPAKQKRIKIMPEPELILSIIKGTSIELPCLLAAWGGMRVSEIRGIKKSDVKDGVMTIHKSVVTVAGEHIEVDRNKTYESTRVIDVPKYIQNLIDQVETEHIVELTRDQIYTRFIKLQYKNGITEPISFHDLRHLNASIMVKLKVPDKYAMERGGWSTNSILKSVYQHTFSNEREVINEQINDYFDEIMK